MKLEQQITQLNSHIEQQTSIQGILSQEKDKLEE